MIQFFQRYVVHNFGLKFLSLLLATGLWFMIAREEQPAEVAIRAPIVFQHVPPQLEISSESIPEAQIRVRAPERTIRQLRVNEVQAEIDLTGVNSGERTFDLTSHQVRHPREADLTPAADLPQAGDAGPHLVPHVRRGSPDPAVRATEGLLSRLGDRWGGLGSPRLGSSGAGLIDQTVCGSRGATGWPARPSVDRPVLVARRTPAPIAWGFT